MLQPSYISKSIGLKDTRYLYIENVLTKVTIESSFNDLSIKNLQMVRLNNIVHRHRYPESLGLDAHYTPISAIGQETAR